MNGEKVDVDLYIEALRQQRNQAMDSVAAAVTRSTMFKQENAKLREELERAQQRIAELEQQAPRS